MAGVHGDALGAVRGGRVPEIDVVADIGGGQRDRDGVWLVPGLEADGQGAVAVCAFDPPALAVAEEPLTTPPRSWCPVGLGAVDAAGHDDIAAADGQSVADGAVAVSSTCPAWMRSVRAR